MTPETDAVTGPQGIVTRYEYDDLGRLTAVVENYLPASAASNDTNVRTEYTYNVSGKRLTIRDGNATRHSVPTTVLDCQMLPTGIDCVISAASWT